MSMELGLDERAICRIAAALDRLAEWEAARGNSLEAAGVKSLADRWCKAFRVVRPRQRVIVPG